MANPFLHIGIVDVTTVGSTICQREIAKLGGPDAHHPEFSVHSLPFSQYKKCVLEKDWDTLSHLILISIEKLSSIGAQLAIIPSNTPHYWIEKIQANSPIPVLNLIEISAAECQLQSYSRVAVLGTHATMSGGLYEPYFSKAGVEFVKLSESLMRDIDQFIMDEIVPDCVNFETSQKVREQILGLDVDAVILGCTELPEVYPDLEIPFVDTTRLLAKKAFERSTADLA